MKIRAIPRESLCPVCERGWLQQSNQRSHYKQLGHFLWPCSVVCDWCGYTRPHYPAYVGIPVDEASDTGEKAIELINEVANVQPIKLG